MDVNLTSINKVTIQSVKLKSMESREYLRQARNKMTDAYSNFRKYYKQDENEELSRYKKMCVDKIEEIDAMINQLNTTINECDIFLSK